MDNEIKTFESGFDTSIKEVLVLTEGGTGAGRLGKNKYWTARVTVLGTIDTSTGELVTEKKILTWLMTNEQCDSSKKVFDIKAETIYRLKVRESLEYNNNLAPGGVCKKGERLLVLEALKRNCKDERLQSILDEYKKPVTINPIGCKELLLDKSLGMFSGECQWNGEKSYINIDVDMEGTQVATNTLATWNVLYNECATWDKKAREFAAKELVDNANDWAYDGAEDGEEPEVITKEIFAERMHISEVCVSTNGNFDIYYDDDDMFWGHVIIVSGNISTGIDDATIAG